MWGDLNTTSVWHHRPITTCRPSVVFPTNHDVGGSGGGRITSPSRAKKLARSLSECVTLAKPVPHR